MNKPRLSKRVLNMQRFGKIAQERKKVLKKNPTPAESKFITILRKYNIPFGFQKVIFLEKNFYILDFVISMKPRRIIELDGDSHIGREEYDAKRTENIFRHRIFRKKKLRFELIRIRNEQVYSGEAEKIIRGIYKGRADKYDKIPHSPTR